MPALTSDEDATLIAGSNAGLPIDTLCHQLPGRSKQSIFNRRMTLREGGAAIVAAKQGRPANVTATIDREEAAFYAQSRTASAALRDAIFVMARRLHV